MDDDLKRIAGRIRRWRDEAGLTLQQLGDQSGVSASTIHKIENLQTVPTIAVLLKVANGLNRRPSELLAEEDTGKQVAILRRDDRQQLVMNGHGQLEHLIGMIPRNRLDLWRVRIEPGRGAGRPGTEAWRFHGEVVLLVEDGRVDVEVAGEHFVIERGDSIHFDPSLPHRWIAGGGKAATLLVLAIIPARLQGDLMARIAMATGTSSLDAARVEVGGDGRIEAAGA